MNSEVVKTDCDFGRDASKINELESIGNKKKPETGSGFLHY